MGVKENAASPRTTNAQANQKKEARRRLREILSVLLHHDIVGGLTPEKLRGILEDLGPTFVKFGQILSMRQDILPKEYCDELMKLRTDVKPMPYEEVAQAVLEEYGKPPEEVFVSFEREPLGSASIAQVHRAVLFKDRQVVVKVQRPHIREVMELDISLLHRATKMLKLAPSLANTVDFNMVLDEMWAVAQQEMNFLEEAANAERFANNNREFVYIGCPRIYHDYTTEKILVMEYIDGIQVDDIAQLEEAGYDRVEIGRKLAENYVTQIVDQAYFHADPHPGNIRIREGQIVWIDLGMMGTIAKRDQELLKRGVLALVKGNVDELKTVLLTLGEHNGKINHPGLYGDIDDFLLRYGSMELGEMDLGRMMEDVLTLASAHHISMPPGISMLARGVVTIQGVLSTLDPEASIVEIMAAHLSATALQNLDIGKELKESGLTLLSSGKKAMDIPAQLSDILKMTIKGQTKLNLEVTGSEEPLAQVDKMVNRLILCIITAALLLGSSLLCTTDMQPKVLGIPLLGSLGYLLALILGGKLLYNIKKKK